MFSLQTMHTFGFPTSAKAFHLVHTLEEVKRQLSDNPIEPIYILGEGSNSVFLEDFLGTVLKISILGVSLQETPDDYILTVGAGENWHNLVVWCLARGIYGFENLALIPGTVGAAPIQNIGAYGVEIEQFIEHIEFLCLDSSQIKSIAGKDCQFGYRDSIFKRQLSRKFVIGSVTFKLSKNWQAKANYAELNYMTDPTAQQIFDKVVQVRRLKLPDPKVSGNAGSFFKNPIISIDLLSSLLERFPNMPSYPVSLKQVKVPAAWLIDTLGFKGKSVGGIHCHLNQPLVLTNDGTGKGDDLLNLAQQIKLAVRKTFSIELENEVQLVSNLGLINV